MHGKLAGSATVNTPSPPGQAGPVSVSPPAGRGWPSGALVLPPGSWERGPAGFGPQGEESGSPPVLVLFWSPQGIPSVCGGGGGGGE